MRADLAKCAQIYLNMRRFDFFYKRRLIPVHAHHCQTHIAKLVEARYSANALRHDTPSNEQTLHC